MNFTLHHRSQQGTAGPIIPSVSLHSTLPPSYTLVRSFVRSYLVCCGRSRHYDRGRGRCNATQSFQQDTVVCSCLYSFFLQNKCLDDRPGIRWPASSTARRHGRDAAYVSAIGRRLLFCVYAEFFLLSTPARQQPRELEKAIV